MIALPLTVVSSRRKSPATKLTNPFEEMPLMRIAAACILISSLVLSSSAPAQERAPLLLREPALSASEICFSFAGDLWTVPRTGGIAHRLTASTGTE